MRALSLGDAVKHRRRPERSRAHRRKRGDTHARPAVSGAQRALSSAQRIGQLHAHARVAVSERLLGWRDRHHHEGDGTAWPVQPVHTRHGLVHAVARDRARELRTMHRGRQRLVCRWHRLQQGGLRRGKRVHVGTERARRISSPAAVSPVRYSRRTPWRARRVSSSPRSRRSSDSTSLPRITMRRSPTGCSRSRRPR